MEKVVGRSAAGREGDGVVLRMPGRGRGMAPLNVREAAMEKINPIAWDLGDGNSFVPRPPPLPQPQTNSLKTEMPPPVLVMGRGRPTAPPTSGVGSATHANGRGRGKKTETRAHPPPEPDSIRPRRHPPPEQAPQPAGFSGFRQSTVPANGKTVYPRPPTKPVYSTPPTVQPKPSPPVSQPQTNVNDVVKPFGGFREILETMKLNEEKKWKGLPQIRKSFYSEHPEVAVMTPEQVNAFRESRNDISVVDLANENREPPKPVSQFYHAFHNYPDILAELVKVGFLEPTPIQSQMWPMALGGQDVIGIAQTGTGKTLGFLLPIFIHIDNQPTPRAERNGPSCIVLTPTRELALQINLEVGKYSYRGIKSVCVYGGGDRRKQMATCVEGVDVVIATPGRLNDLVCAGCINLHSVTFLVLDEADRMLDLGFEPQIKKVLLDVRPDRHTIMTSATWPSLVRELACRYSTKPFLVYVGSLDLTACHSVRQLVEIVEEDHKKARLLKFISDLKSDEKTIIFVGKKIIADDVSSDLGRSGVDCECLHGDRDQADRERALRDLREGRASILVATDVASRGLDIPNITHVFNYDFPRNIEEYVHRVGRTGRAGKSGTSITLMTGRDWRHAAELIRIIEEARQMVPDGLRKMAERFLQRQARGPPPGRGRYQRRGASSQFWDPRTPSANF